MQGNGQSAAQALHQFMRAMTTYEFSGCPACRARRLRAVANEHQIKQELESLWQFHLRRLKTGAPLEQFFDRAIFTQHPPLHVVACMDCGTVFRNPRERAPDVVATYASEVPSTESFDSLFAQQQAFFRPRVARLTRLLGGPGSLLEAGSYIGAFLTAAAAAGWRAVGLDVNTHACAYARERGCTVAEAALEDYRSPGAFDAVTLWNCFDQLPDPHETLAKVRQLVKPGGMLALRVPNGDFYTRVRRLPSVWRRSLLAWNNLASFPYRHGFTARALRLLCAQHEFDVVQLSGDVLVPISGSWTRPWARWEERILKTGMRLAVRGAHAPWLEVYARRAA